MFFKRLINIAVFLGLAMLSGIISGTFGMLLLKSDHIHHIQGSVEGIFGMTFALISVFGLIFTVGCLGAGIGSLFTGNGLVWHRIDPDEFIANADGSEHKRFDKTVWIHCDDPILKGRHIMGSPLFGFGISLPRSY